MKTVNTTIKMLAVAALVLFVSCGKEERNTDSDSQNTTVNAGQTVTFEATGGALSRTQLVGGNSVEWLSGDAITIFDGSTPIESVTADSGSSATFQATLATAGPWYALYPADGSAGIDGSNKITTTLPAVQDAVANSFDDDLNISIALSSGSSLSFKNALGLIRFTAGESNIKSVTLAGNNSEIVAGEVAFNYNAGAPTWENVSGVTSITLSGPLTKGSVYYFAVLPQTFTNGFKLTYTDTADNETVHSTSNVLTLGRSTIYDIGSPDIVVFKDPKVKAALLANVAGIDANSDGEISKTEAAAVDQATMDALSPATLWGSDLTAITSFDEFKYFTGLSTAPAVFTGCSALESITLPSSVTSIANSAFKDCSNLVSVNQPVASVTQVFANAFANCTALATISFLSNNVTKMGGAFDGCSSLVSVSFGGTLTTIDQYAFRNCSSLESVTIPASVTTIGKQTFSGCSSLTELNIENVTTISDNLCTGCSNLTKVKVSSSLTSIGKNAFQNCNKLATFTDTGETGVFRIPANVTILNDYSFDACFVLPNPDLSRCTALATLGSRCFRGCRAFTAVDVPATVAKMTECFQPSGTMSLTQVTIRRATPPTSTTNGIFRGWSAPYPIIYVPSSAVDTYKTTTNWSMYADYIKAIQ